MKIFITILGVIISVCSNAQSNVKVEKDPRLDALTAKQILINKRATMMTSNGLYHGYRLQVLSTNKRDDAFKMKADILTKFPNEKAYILFQSPYFKVRMGNYLKRGDAEKMKQYISKIYTQGCYIVEDGIEYTPKDDEDISK